MRRRADIVLVARGFFASRAKAREAIEAGLVSVDGLALHKPAQAIDETSQISARPPYPWVSRAGLKLEAALDAFGVDPKGLVCLDLGSSTGGFSHVLLSRGAACVCAVDVGRGQLHASLLADPRLRSFEGCDAREIDPSMFPKPPELIVADVSFISLRLALSPALSLAASDARLTALIKPQFEAGPRDVKKGLVKSADTQRRVCREIADFLESEDWTVRGVIDSPILGGDGNREFLIGADRKR